MSQRVVRYEGDGRHRRPVYEDEGPASSAGRGHEPGSGRAEMARLGALATDRLIPTGGAGPIERRLVTDAQRAATRAVAEGERPPMGSAAHLHKSRMRGADRHVEVMTARRTPLITLADPPVTPPEESPMEAAAAVPEPTEPAETLGESLAVLLDATTAAEAAWRLREELRAKHASLSALLDGAEASWIGARAALEASWLATWVGFQGPLPDDVLPPFEPSGETWRTSSTDDPQAPWTSGAVEDPGVAPAEVPQGVLGGDEPADDAPETVPASRLPAPGAAPVGITAHQQRILDAALRLGGDFVAIGAEVGCSRQNARLALETIGRKGLLPIDLIPRLPAGFAKFTGV